MTRVCRLGVGDRVRVFDGAGREWAGRLTDITRGQVAIALAESLVSTPEPSVFVTLGVAVLKGDQMDTVIRDATMMGVGAFVPFVSLHVAVAERAWRTRSIDRWTRVAVAAAKQSGRAVVPAVAAVQPFAAVVTDTEFDARVLCVEPASGEAGAVTSLARPRRALVLVGPEGGWSREELDLARASGGQFISLGPRTLRAEAAPIVALAALWTHWGWT
jgi:16S rRNA (uracil1498-N3)-methyltransferase